MIVHCKICGKPVEVKSPNVKYCDECRRKKYETTYRIKGEEEAIKYAYQKRVEQMRAKRNGPSIEEVVREANKEGLSYGQYVRTNRQLRRPATLLLFIWHMYDRRTCH